MKIISNYHDCIDFLMTPEDKQRVFQRFQRYDNHYIFLDQICSTYKDTILTRSPEKCYPCLDKTLNYAGVFFFIGYIYLVYVKIDPCKLNCKISIQYPITDDTYEIITGIDRNNPRSRWKSPDIHHTDVPNEKKSIQMASVIHSTFEQNNIIAPWFLVLITSRLGYGKLPIWENPPLVNFPFLFAEKDIREVYQEIEQFIWKDADENKQKPISDKLKIETHGFDLKTSFRNIK